MKIIAMLSKNLLVVFLFLSLFLSFHAYGETNDFSSLINKHDKLIGLLKRHKDKAAISEITAALKYKTSNIKDFNKASKAFSVSRRYYEKALEDLNAARNLIKKGIESEDGNVYIEQGKAYINKGIVSCNEGMVNFKRGLYFLDNAKSSKGGKVKTAKTGIHI